MGSIRSRKGGKESPRGPVGGVKDQKKDPERMSAVERLKLARKLARDGKKKRYIQKKTGLERDDIDAIVAAEKGQQLRKGHREILKQNLRKIQKLTSIAYAAYEDNPSGYNAGAINTLSAEVRSLISDIDDLQRPETMALEIIQSIMQPFVNDSLREIVSELRRTRNECLRVAESPEARIAINKAFERLTRALGVVFKDTYGQYAEKLGILLQCDLEDLKTLAADGKRALEEAAEEGHSNVVPLEARR